MLRRPRCFPTPVFRSKVPWLHRSNHLLIKYKHRPIGKQKEERNESLKSTVELPAFSRLSGGWVRVNPAIVNSDNGLIHPLSSTWNLSPGHSANNELNKARRRLISGRWKRQLLIAIRDGGDPDPIRGLAGCCWLILDGSVLWLTAIRKINSMKLSWNDTKTETTIVAGIKWWWNDPVLPIGRFLSCWDWAERGDQALALLSNQSGKKLHQASIIWVAWLIITWRAACDDPASDGRATSHRRLLTAIEIPYTSRHEGEWEPRGLESK